MEKDDPDYNLIIRSAPRTPTSNANNPESKNNSSTAQNLGNWGLQSRETLDWTRADEWYCIGLARELTLLHIALWFIDLLNPESSEA